MLKRLVCRLIGHSSDWEAECYGYDHCLRCGDWNSIRDPHWHTDTGFWLDWYALKGWTGFRWRRLKDWWRCPDCNERWGRHDHDNCIPF